MNPQGLKNQSVGEGANARHQGVELTEHLLLETYPDSYFKSQQGQCLHIYKSLTGCPATVLSHFDEYKSLYGPPGLEYASVVVDPY